MVSLVNHLSKILGVHFSCTKSVAETQNFQSHENKIQISTKIWGQRWLALAGKIQVFKSLIVSVPIFVATMKSIPESFLKEIHSLHKD